MFAFLRSQRRRVFASLLLNALALAACASAPGSGSSATLPSSAPASSVAPATGSGESGILGGWTPIVDRP